MKLHRFREGHRPRRQLCAALICLVALAPGAGWPELGAPVVSRKPSPGAHARAAGGVQAAKRNLKLPVRFEQNMGQADSAAKFIAKGAGPPTSLTDTGALTLSASPGNRWARPAGGAGMHLVGANPAPVVAGRKRLGARIAYFIGADPALWRPNVPAFARVRYQQVYPGIDLEYHGARGRLEYDFIVAPGASPAGIGLQFNASSVLVDRNGDLVLRTAMGRLRHRRPVIYQQTQAGRRRVSGGYLIHNDRTVGFKLGAYDRSKTLIIDPEIVYSSYFGGNSYERTWDISAPDDSGQVYIAGYTSSVDLPGGVKRQDGYGGGNVGQPGSTGEQGDGFIAKFDTTKQGEESLVFAAYLGGGEQDVVSDIEVDPQGNIFVIGNTYVLSSTGQPAQSNFPGLERLPDLAGQEDCGSKAAGFDIKVFGFIAKLSPNAAQIDYSKCLLGSFADGYNSLYAGGGLSIDTGHVYAAGRTANPQFGTRNAAQDSFGGGDTDAFLVKLAADGSRVDYSTFLGGALADQAIDMAADSFGNAYITGVTGSANFPTRDALQANRNGFNDAFVAKIDTNTQGADSLRMSTYLGGSGRETGRAIAVDRAQNAYVAGETGSRDFPTHNAFQPAASSADAASPAGLSLEYGFVAKLDTARAGTVTPVVYSTYLSGSAGASALAIAVDAKGSAHVAGGTGSPDFPIKHPFQPLSLSSPALKGSAFVSKLSPSGGELVYSSYVGGDASDSANGVVVDPSANVYLTGSTSSDLFPNNNAYQAQRGGGYLDGFLMKIAPRLPRILEVVPSSGPTSGGTAVLVRGEGFPDPAEIIESARLGETPLAVHFGNTPAQEATPISTTLIRAVSPAREAGTVDVTVTNFEGTSATVPEDKFTYFASPPVGGPPGNNSPGPDLTDHSTGKGAPLNSGTSALADTASSATPAIPPLSPVPATVGLPHGPLPPPPAPPVAGAAGAGAAPGLHAFPGMIAPNAANPGLIAPAPDWEGNPAPAPRFSMVGGAAAMGFPAGLVLLCLLWLFVYGFRGRMLSGPAPAPAVALASRGADR